MFEEIWWIFPLVMVIFCIFMMRGCMRSMMCSGRSHRKDSHMMREEDSVKEILEKRYALGEITREEFEEKKRDLNQQR